jgi:quinohemoprotein ethanol dehydrogenase
MAVARSTCAMIRRTSQFITRELQVTLWAFWMLKSHYRRGLLPLTIIAVLCPTAAWTQQPNSAVVRSAPLLTSTGAGYGRADAARLRSADSEPGEWLTNGRDGTYNSLLKQINDKTVEDLGFAWEFSTETHRGLEATPLVVDGIMYTTGNWGAVYALDAATGRQKWRYDPKSDPKVARYETNDVVNRGLAIWRGAVYVVSADCRLIAISADRGVKLWETNTLVDRAQPYVCSGAPQLAGDAVVVGNSGADNSQGGLRGYISAFDLHTGQLLWRFYTVPALGDTDAAPELKLAASTWDPKRDPSFGGGGAVWDAMAYDPDLGLLYIGTGNSAPYNAPREAQGHSTDNLYTASIIALHADTGRMAWYFQTTPGDRWDYDAASPMVLADLQIAGDKRTALLQANKNGYFYVLDRATGKPISAKPFVYVNWASGLDDKFRPVVTSDADYHTSPKLIYPGMQGAHSWQPMSYSPQTGLVYIPANDAPNVLIDLHRNPGAQISFIDEASDGVGYVYPDHDYDPAAWQPLFGPLPKVASSNPHTGKALVRSMIKAWDPVKQRVVWEQQTSADYFLLDGGTLSTAGNLVFAGREDGHFVAYAADSGALLKSLDTGTPIMSAPVTYEVAGTQYVAVMAAHGGEYMNSFAGTAAMKYVNEGRIIAFKLGAPADVPKPMLRVTERYATPPARAGTAAQIDAGSKLFNVWCARCHALGVPGVTPDLSRLNDGIATPEVFRAIVLQGALASRGMPRFSDVLSPADAEALHDYLIGQSWNGYTAQGAKRSTSQQR